MAEKKVKIFHVDQILRAAILSLVLFVACGGTIGSAGKELTEPEFNDFFVVDGHTHDLVERNKQKSTQAGMERLPAAGIDGIILFFPLNRTPPETVVQQILKDKEFVTKTARENKLALHFVKEFSVSAAPHSLQVIMGAEYDGQFGDNLDRVDQLKAAGVSVVTLDDNGLDRLSEEKNGALTLSAFARKLIRKLNANEIRIDISHLPEELQLETIKMSAGPLFASHSNVRRVADVRRNVSDKVLAELIYRGGILLFTFDRTYLFGYGPVSEANGINKLLEHIDHVAGKYGADKIGIGTDYGGAGLNATSDMFHIGCFREIAKRLIKKGYSRDQVRNIMGGNIVRFLSKKSKGGT
jgi:membrane dipeptidase